MGAANVIPGVSGGTVAFISGIYERLIKALKSFDLQIVKLLFKGRFSELRKKTDLLFLLILFAGIGLSVLSLAGVLEHAFEYYERLTLAFFFGLILASIIGVGRQISEFHLGIVVAFVVGFLVALLLAFLTPATANDNWLYILLCGIVAISSMILPGLSGSYVLLLMGNYVLMLQAIVDLNVKILIPFGLGCILGLAIFSRVLSYLFDHFKNATISLLTGFVAGSLLIIWPWKTTNYLMINEKQKAIGYDWNLPVIDQEFFIAIGLMAVGFLIVYGIDKLGRAK